MRHVLYNSDLLHVYFAHFSRHEAPAVQVAEHAAAILADDAARGIQRKDISLQRLARAGAAHSVP